MLPTTRIQYVSPRLFKKASRLVWRTRNQLSLALAFTWFFRWARSYSKCPRSFAQLVKCIWMALNLVISVVDFWDLGLGYFHFLDILVVQGVVDIWSHWFCSMRHASTWHETCSVINQHKSHVSHHGTRIPGKLEIPESYLQPGSINTSMLHVHTVWTKTTVQLGTWHLLSAGGGGRVEIIKISEFFGTPPP